MICALFRKTLKQNWVLGLIFFGVLTMYMTTMLSMYDPEDMAGLILMIEAFPEGMRAAFGFDALATDITGYLAGWLYGVLMIGFPMVYSAIMGNRLVARMVDNGSFAYLLSTPHTRAKIIVTQGLYALASLSTMFVAVFTAGVLAAEAMFPGNLNVGAFFRLNVTTMLVNMVVMMIAFFFSCVFNEARLSVAFGSGIPIAFLLLHMLGGSAPDLEVLSAISIFGFYDPVELVKGAPMWATNLAYVGIITALFAAGTMIFSRKRLPL